MKTFRDWLALRKRMQFQNVINDLSEGWSKKDQERFDRLKDKAPSSYSIFDFKRKRRKSPSEDK